MKSTKPIVGLHDTAAVPADDGILSTLGGDALAGGLDMSDLPGCRLLAVSFATDKATTIKVTKTRGASTTESFLLRSESVPAHECRGPIEVPVWGDDVVDFTAQTDDVSFDYFNVEAVFSEAR